MVNYKLHIVLKASTRK